MSKPRIIDNNICLKCDAVEREMVRVGAIVMCRRCFSEEFVSDNPVHDERPNYLKWLHKRDEAEQQ